MVSQIHAAWVKYPATAEQLLGRSPYWQRRQVDDAMAEDEDD